MSELQIEILGELQGDPAVYAFHKNSGEACLFDLGSIDRISQRDLMRVKHVFISHAHMDHFMGFDRWLRVNIPHRRILKIWGPAPFFERVQARLKSFAWNLIEPDQLRFEVGEIQGDGTIKRAMIRNTTNFAIEAMDAHDLVQGLIPLTDGSVVSIARLSHVNITSLAFRIQGPQKQKFLSENLETFGLKRGPWISRLQTQLAYHPEEKEFVIDDRTFSIDVLEQALIRKEKGPSFAYLTDLSFDRKNLAEITRCFASVDRVVCEASFLDQDRARAVSKAHLTTRQAALIAMALSAKRFDIFHVSTIYGNGASESVAEAKSFFDSYMCLDAKGKLSALEEEFLAVENLTN